MLQRNMTEGNQDLDISGGGTYYDSVAAGEKRWQRWNRIEILPGKAPQPGARQGGADCNLIYEGPHDPETDALLKQVGVGLKLDESCLIRACELGGVPEWQLANMRAIILTQFQDERKQAAWILSELNIPASLVEWDEKWNRGIRTKKDCPGGEAKFQINLYRHHYFKGTFEEAKRYRELC
jgi:hypothetical protein